MSSTQEPDSLPAFRFAMEDQTPRTGQGGSAREASITQFPVSQGIAGVSMRLDSGTIRELHWHANAAEWAYVVQGNCRTTIFSPDGSSEMTDFTAGDIWYFPRGYGHSIQGLGPGACHFILVFDNGAFSEFATFSFSDWLAHTPPDVLTKNLNLSASDLKQLPTEEVYFAQGPIGAPAQPSAANSTHRFRLDAQTPRKFKGGELRLVTVNDFPISTTMAGATMKLEPGGLRELHWHPNADEWQYVLEGTMRMTVFASKGRAETVELSAGDVGYVPRGYGHYLQNVGQGPCRILLVFNDGTYEDIDLTGWIASNPKRIVATNLGVPESMVEKMPGEILFITD